MRDTSVNHKCRDCNWPNIGGINPVQTVLLPNMVQFFLFYFFCCRKSICGKVRQVFCKQSLFVISIKSKWFCKNVDWLVVGKKTPQVS